MFAYIVAIKQHRKAASKCWQNVMKFELKQTNLCNRKSFKAKVKCAR